MCVLKKQTITIKEAPLSYNFIFFARKRKKNYFKKFCSWNSFRETLNRTKRDFTFQISFVDRVETWFLYFSLFTKKRVVWW